MESSIPGEPGQAFPAPAAPPKPKKGMMLGGLVLVLLALVLGIVSMIGAWWSLKATTVIISMEMSLGLFQACAVGVCQGYSTAPGALQNVMSMTMLMVVLGVVFALLTMILIPVAARKPKLKIAVLLFGIIGSVVMLLAFVYFMTALPGAITSWLGSTYSGVGSFSGSISALGTELSWGGGMGWYMALVSFLMLLLGTILAFAGIRKASA